jgi:hypothetical protein
MPQESGSFTIEDDRRDLNERRAEFSKELLQSDAAVDAMFLDDEALRNKFIRLAFWTGVFSGFSSRTTWHEKQGDNIFYALLLASKMEIDRLFADYTRIRSGRIAAAAPPAYAAPARPNVVEQEQREVRIMQITGDTQRNKATDLQTLINVPAYSVGQQRLVDYEPPAEFCGAIHMMCGHSTTHGRCYKKMAHGIEVRDAQHQCRLCGQMFSR